MSQNGTVIKIKTFCASVLSLPKVLISIIKRNVQIFINKTSTKHRKIKQIFLIGTPEYGNLGDQIIAVAELEWLKKYYPDCEIKEFTHETLMKDKNCRMLLSQIGKNDLIFLQGGGNLNDLYLNCEGIRRRVISACPENKIVLFQQSVFFSETEKGKKVKEETCSVYNKHREFTIITRENKSFETAKEIFDQLKVLKYPDMATYLFGKIKPDADIKANGIVTCLRDDNEKFHSDEELLRIKSQLEKDNVIITTDTNIKRVVTPENRLREIGCLINKIASHRVMITDRFHGVIFSILAGTPCVVLRSSDHKIVEGVKWFKDVEGVFYAENIDDVPMLVEKAKAVGRIVPPDFTHYFDDLYKELNI